MSYQVLSLKWRPKSFDQIIGQDHVTHTLKNAISMDRLAQAFLFSGPRGVGKTTTARVLASTVNKIENYQSSLDIIELDGASNRGIDEIREIRDSVNFPPTSSDYKIYIIDCTIYYGNIGLKSRPSSSLKLYIKFIFCIA